MAGPVQSRKKGMKDLRVGDFEGLQDARFALWALQ